MLDDGAVERVLVVMAHPDDVDFGCAGTVARWVRGGLQVSYCIITDGDAGGFDERVPRADIGPMRRGEQRAAAGVLGVAEVTFLGYPDGRLTPSMDLRRDISREIRRVRPQRVLCQSPVRNFDRLPASHPDHMAAGEATLCAVYPDARNPFAHPELAADGLAPYAVPEVWVSGMPDARHPVDITDVFDRKIAALRAHTSQTAHMSDLEGRLRGWAVANAAAAGLPDGRLAEVFRVINVPV